MTYFKKNKTIKPRVWTETAIFCYERGCNCQGCYIKSIINEECKMKKSVLETVRILGRPEKNKYKVSQKVIETLNLYVDGYNYKEIALMQKLRIDCVKGRISRVKTEYYLELKKAGYKKFERKMQSLFIEWCKNNLLNEV